MDPRVQKPSSFLLPPSTILCTTPFFAFLIISLLLPIACTLQQTSPQHLLPPATTQLHPLPSSLLSFLPTRTFPTQNSPLTFSCCRAIALSSCRWALWKQATESCFLQ